MRNYKWQSQLAFLFLIVFLAACAVQPQPVPTQPTPQPTPSPTPTTSTKKDNPRVLLTMTQEAFEQALAIAGEEQLRKVDTAGPEDKLLKVLTRKEQLEQLEAAQVHIEDSTTTFPFKYVPPGFTERMGKGVPRDEAGNIIVNDGYHDNFMVEDLLQAFNESYPEITYLTSIGKSWQGRDLWALKISDNPEEEDDEPAFLFVGAHHANELLSIEHVLDIIEYLTVNYERDDKVRSWIDSYEIWCIPVANPDGLYRLFHVKGSGRKNGRDTIPNGEIDARDGVDLNRNYPFSWHTLGEKASNSNPEHWWYRGPEAGSEPEVQAIMQLAEQQRFIMLLSFHTAATKILVPYTIDKVRNPEPSVAWMIGKQMAGRADSGREDKQYKAVRKLYSVDGTDQDWHYWKYGTLAYIWESSRYQPDYEKERDQLVKGIRPAWVYLLDRLTTGPTLSGHVLDAETGTPLEAVITIDEIENFEGEVHTSHPENGRFDKILPEEGVYHLTFTKEGYLPHTTGVEVGKEWKNDLLVELTNTVKEAVRE